MSADLHPERLTIEMVLENYGRLLKHRISTFHTQDSIEDSFQSILTAMITPSATLGTSYLDRYNPSRGTAKAYVLMFCIQQMMKIREREKNRRRLMPDPLPLVFEDAEELDESGSDAVPESTVADPAWSTTMQDSTVRTPRDLRKLLQGTKHVLAHSFSPSGEPRSTVYMLELLLWGGLSTTEIAQRLAVTTSEVSRRFKALRTEPRILRLLTDNLRTEAVTLAG